MKNIENYIFTVFEFTKTGNKVKFCCCGCKELIKVKSILPNYIKGQIEYQGQLIPLIDLGQQFCDSPTAINQDCCVVVCEHFFDRRKLYSGFIVESFEKILEITLWDMNEPAIINSDQSTSVIIDFIKGIDDYSEKILWKNHLLMSYLSQQHQEPMMIS